MGIPGFTKALRPYLTPTSLSGENVVIDGPALAHAILRYCTAAQQTNATVLGHLAYRAIGERTIKWLDVLRDNNVHVRKIYFDGYLPPRKWGVRRRRLREQTRIIRRLFGADLRFEPLSSPPPGNSSSSPGLERPDFQPAAENNALPKPAFLVPAVIECLRASPTWRSAVQIVPGEADAYCAADVKEHGGSVLTSDSDLLVQDLGASGGVVFFHDLENVPSDMGAPSVPRHCPTDLGKRLGVEQGGGMLRLAYEFSRDRMTTDKAVQNSKSPYATSTLTSESFLEFCEQHLPKEYIHESEPIVPMLSNLDPRISEMIIQSLNIEVERQSSPVGPFSGPRKPRGPEEVSIWLPVLIEDQSRKSCWSMSEPIRQIAYGISQSSHADTRREYMIEYRKLDSALGGRRVEIPDDSSSGQLREHWLGVMDKLQGSKNPWMALALYQDIAWSLSEQRDPLSLILAQEVIEAGAKAATYSWEHVHFASQVQACFYSLRILKQTLGVLARMRPENFPSASPWNSLRDRLLGLPPIDEWPTAWEIPKLLTEFMQDDGISRLAKVLEVDERDLRSRSPPGRNKRAHKTETKPAANVRRRDQLSSNPFSALG